MAHPPKKSRLRALIWVSRAEISTYPDNDFSDWDRGGPPKRNMKCLKWQFCFLTSWNLHQGQRTAHVNATCVTSKGGQGKIKDTPTGRWGGQSVPPLSPLCLLQSLFVTSSMCSTRCKQHANNMHLTHVAFPCVVLCLQCYYMLHLRVTWAVHQPQNETGQLAPAGWTYCPCQCPQATLSIVYFRTKSPFYPSNKNRST
jgi:hypothetical protein